MSRPSPAIGRKKNSADEIAFDGKELYEKRRDAFRNDPEVSEELDRWKAQDHDFAYEKISVGFIPNRLIDKSGGDAQPFQRADTFFSEYEIHNDNSLILSADDYSYIIGNRASYDHRQYPEWLNPNYQFGKTPEGQGFGHALVISRKRVYNIVDPEATADNVKLLKQMRDHFIAFWNTNEGKMVLLQSTRQNFERQNQELYAKKPSMATYDALIGQLEADFNQLKQLFLGLHTDDFVFAFHAFPDSSIGHLHMHVFPRLDALRKFSAKQHDWKTISLDAILDAEGANND